MCMYPGWGLIGMQKSGTRALTLLHAPALKSNPKTRKEQTVTITMPSFLCLAFLLILYMSTE